MPRHFNPNGGATSYHFDWGGTAAYGNVTPTQTLDPGGAPVVSAGLSGLPSGTLIHFRLVASNPLGPAAGADNTLTTALPPPLPGQAFLPPPNQPLASPAASKKAKPKKSCSRASTRGHGKKKTKAKSCKKKKKAKKGHRRV